MKAGRALIGNIFQNKRIKNLRGGREVRFKKKLDSFTLETSKNHLIRNFLRATGVWGLITTKNPVKRNCDLKICACSKWTGLILWKNVNYPKY